MLILGRKRSKTLIEGLCRLSKGCVGQIRIDVAKVGMIEDVEAFCAELKMEGIVQGKVASDCEIHLFFVESANEVARCIANQSG